MSIDFLILGYQQTQKMQEKAITSKLTKWFRADDTTIV